MDCRVGDRCRDRKPGNDGRDASIPAERALAISLSWLELAYCGVVIVACYALRGSTGFGGAVAMPLLALVVPLKILVPV